MNRAGGIDSKLSLDTGDRSDHIVPSDTGVWRVRVEEASVLLHRVDPARRMSRFYALSLEVTLFEEWSCTRSYGRIGGRGGRVMIGLYESKCAAEAAFQHVLRAKVARGYRGVEHRE